MEPWMRRMMRYARRQQGLTRKQAAGLCGLTGRRYARIEQGKSDPDTGEAESICRVQVLTVR